MAEKRTIEIFSAGCPVCDEAVKEVKAAACPSCEVSVLDMKDPRVAERARGLGVKSVPAVAINGKLAGCCSGRGIDLEVLRKEGLGQPLA
jgi:hypothetical protein